jgi:hypothetical protein
LARSSVPQRLAVEQAGGIERSQHHVVLAGREHDLHQARLDPIEALRHE